MPKLTNPVGNQANYSLSIHNTTIRETGMQLTSGYDTSNLVNNITAASLDIDNIRAGNISSGITYASSFNEVVKSTLANVSKILVDQFALISQAGQTSDATTIAKLNKAYQENIASVNNMLKTASFDNSFIFNGQYTDGIVDSAATALAPRKRTAMNVTTSVGGGFSKQSIPSLISLSDDTVADIKSNDVKSLFSLNADSTAVRESVKAALLYVFTDGNVAVANDGTTAAPAMGDPSTDIANVICRIDVPAVVAAAMAANSDAMTKVLTGIQDAVRDQRLDPRDAMGTADNTNATYTAILNFIVTDAYVAQSLSADTISALKSIADALSPLGVVTTAADTKAAVDALPMPGNVIGNRLMTAAQGVAAAGGGAKSKQTQAIMAALFVAVGDIVASRYYAGDLNTADGRTKAESCIKYALGVVSDLTTQMETKSKVLEYAQDNNKKLQATSSDASDELIKTDIGLKSKEYKDAVLATRSSIMVNNLAQQLAEQLLTLLQG